MKNIWKTINARIVKRMFSNSDQSNACVACVNLDKIIIDDIPIGLTVIQISENSDLKYYYPPNRVMRKCFGEWDSGKDVRTYLLQQLVSDATSCSMLEKDLELAIQQGNYGTFIPKALGGKDMIRLKSGIEVKIEFKVLLRSISERFPLVLFTCCFDEKRIENYLASCALDEDFVVLDLRRSGRYHGTAFFRDIEKKVELIKEVAAAGLSRASLRTLKREIHGIGPRTYGGFSKISESCRKIEDRIDSILKNEGLLESNLRKELIQNIEEFTSLIDMYRTTAFEKLGWDLKGYEVVSLNIEDLNFIFDVRKNFVNDVVEKGGIPENVSAMIDMVRPNISLLISEFNILCVNTASMLGKPVPRIDYIGQDFRLHQRALSPLREVLGFLINNSIDHGLSESDVDPTITIDVIDDRSNLIISYRDSGKGLDLERIQTKAKESGLFKAVELSSDQEIAECIFKEDFTLKDTYNGVSGRGVGMSGVRNIIENVGGKVTLHLEPRPHNQVCTKFKILIEVSQSWVLG